MAGKLSKIAAVAVFVLMLTMLMPAFADSQTSVDDLTYVISDFENTSGAWKVGENVASVKTADYFTDPLDDTTRRSCLEVVSDETEINWLRSVSAEFTSPIDLINYRKLSFDILTQKYESDPNAGYFARLILTSKNGETVEIFENLTPQSWCTVTADIGEWSGRSEVVSINISLIVDTSVIESSQNRFYIDDVCAYERVDFELVKRFMFDQYTTRGGTARLSSDKTVLTLIPAASEVLTFEASLTPPELTAPANSLRINLANYTDNETLTVTYSTFDTPALSENKTVELKVNKQSPSTYYYINVGDVSKLRRIEFTIGQGAGRVELNSISAVYSYSTQQYETCGTLNSCKLGDDLATVTFIGDLLREEALFNHDGSINIYQLQDSSVPSAEVLSTLEPILKSPMTTRFELSYRLPQKSISELQRWYLAVSMRADGTFVLVCPPFQVQNPERAATVSKSFDRGAKGFAPTDISLAGDSGSDVTVLVLKLSEVLVSKNDGERYVYGGEAYYFNKKIFDGLSKQIDALHDAGTAVLLRLTDLSIDYVAKSKSYNNTESLPEQPNGEEPDGTDYIGALSAYISNLWVGNAKVVGIILGEYNNSTFNGIKSMDSAVEYAAAELRSVYNNVISRNKAAKVYISLSNLYLSELGANGGEFELFEFLPALLAQTALNGQFGWDVCIDNSFRTLKESSSRFVYEYDCGSLIELLDKNGGADKNILFCDAEHQAFSMKLSKSLATYVRGYYAALANQRLDAYIPITSSSTDAIYEVVKLIDTKEGESFSILAQFTLGIEDWTHVIPGFDEDAIPDKKVTLYPASEEFPSGIKGSYSYYTFNKFTGIGDIAPGYHCSDLKISDTEENTLVAMLGSTTSGDWMGISHRFEFPENLSLTPVIEITLKVDSEDPLDGAEVPLKLVLLGEGERFESEASIAVGQWKTLYIYTGNFGKIHDTEAMQLLVGGSSLNKATLSVREFNGLSREYNDESLESVIAEARLKKRAPALSNPYGATFWAGGAIIIAVATVITFALLSKRRDRDGEEE